MRKVRTYDIINAGPRNRFMASGVIVSNSARGIQLQNLPRPHYQTSVDSAVRDILTGDRTTVDILHGPPLSIIADCLRGVVRAAPGHVLMASDLSSIEARVTAWLAKQAKTVEAFAAFDRGEGPDIYKVAASGIVGRPVESITSEERQNIGKVAVLSLGFQGGAAAFGRMAASYGVDVGAIHPTVRRISTPENIIKAEKGWMERGEKTGMEREAFLAAELIKLAWRDDNADIVRCWHECEDAAIKAVLNPKNRFYAGRLAIHASGSFLRVRLPSGRYLSYAYPKVKEVKTPWGTDAYKLQFRGVDSVTHKWGDMGLYGGNLFQNAVQGTARDVLADAMVRADDAGYKPVLTVHDELIVEVPQGFGSFEEFNGLMTTRPDWAPDLPIAAGGFVSERYRK